MGLPFISSKGLPFICLKIAITAFICSNNYKMPRNYKRKTTRNFTEADIESAVLLVKGGAESLSAESKVAHTTGIPRSTLSRWVNNKSNSNFGSGRKTTIPLETEELLVDRIEFLGDLG